MRDDPRIVHVTWGESRAESVRGALHLHGEEAQVIALSGALNVGPLDPTGSGVRQAWAKANLRDDDPEKDWSEPDAPWGAATSPSTHPVYWVCLSDAAEHASFLAFATRMAGRPFDIVDATEVNVPAPSGSSPVRSLGQLRPAEIVACGLHARRRPVSDAQGEAASAAWKRLQRENAPLRVVLERQLVSVPITHFDNVLVGQARSGWELIIELLARTLNHLDNEVTPPGRGISCEFLFARVLALGKAYPFEICDSGPGMRDCEVRLLPDACLPVNRGSASPPR